MKFFGNGHDKEGKSVKTALDAHHSDVGSEFNKLWSQIRRLRENLHELSYRVELLEKSKRNDAVRASRAKKEGEEADPAVSLKLLAGRPLRR